MNKEIGIPEGYEARIEDNKIIIEPKESEDERIRKKILAFVREHGVNHERCQMEKYLEKQKSKELRDSRQIAFMIESARMGGVIEGRKQVIDNPEEYGLCIQSHWKPSKEQMKQLEGAMMLPEFGLMVTTRRQFPDLESLYNDLKKL